MSDIFIPIVFVVLLWWFSTGAILWLARGVDSQMHPRLLIVTVACALGFAGVIISSTSSEVWSVYLAFVSALAIWGWVEFTFLAGLITGPKDTPCPPNISEGKRFAMAYKVICHHEYALVIMMIVLAVLDTSGGTGTAIKTFALLWVMRLGAKLSMFAGAPGISVEMIPARLSYMKSYFKQDKISLTFWVSIISWVIFFVAGVYALATVNYSAAIQTQIIILTSLVGLAILEHIFMVLPIKDSKLWHWAMPEKGNGANKEIHTTDGLPSLEK